MRIEDNPFYILEASARDNRNTLIEKAEDKSLELDSSICDNARNILTTPRSRLLAELSWFPTTNDDIIFKAIKTIQAGKQIEEQLLSKFDPLGKLNIYNFYILNIKQLDFYKVCSIIYKMSDLFENINFDSICNNINSDRRKSGYSEITDISLLEEGIQELQIEYSKVLKNIINKFYSIDIIKLFSEIVEKSTDKGKKICPKIIGNLVDIYEIETKNFINSEEENINQLLKYINEDIKNNIEENKLKNHIKNMIIVVNNWNFIAYPIQIYYKSRGLEHPDSNQLAMKIRSNIVDFYNKYDKLELSLQLSSEMKKIFKEIDSFVSRLDEDEKQLQSILDRKKEEEQKIYLEISIGLLFKDILKITGKGIYYNDNFRKLDSITRVSWGGISQTVNGIPSGANYYVRYGDDYSITSLHIVKKSKYTSIVENIWKAVGSNIISNMISDLKSGKKLRFGSSLISDTGIEIEVSHWFSNNETVFSDWHSVQIFSDNGNFCIQSLNNKSALVSLSYMEMYNIHFLEAMIKLVFQKGRSRLSDAFND